jgi:hypothetical protein
MLFYADLSQCMKNFLLIFSFCMHRQEEIYLSAISCFVVFQSSSYEKDSEFYTRLLWHQRHLYCFRILHAFIMTPETFILFQNSTRVYKYLYYFRILHAFIMTPETFILFQNSTRVYKYDTRDIYTVSEFYMRLLWLQRLLYCFRILHAFIMTPETFIGPTVSEFYTRLLWHQRLLYCFRILHAFIMTPETFTKMYMYCLNYRILLSCTYVLIYLSFCNSFFFNWLKFTENSWFLYLYSFYEIII